MIMLQKRFDIPATSLDVLHNYFGWSKRDYFFKSVS